MASSRALLTLCVIQKDSQVLLGMKKYGRGQGHWNGFGGKVENGETLEEAAKREVLEETGLAVYNLEKVGIIDFEFRDENLILQMHVFHTSDFEGHPVETEEMKPQWFAVDDIPLNAMWPADAHWFPLCLSGSKFRGYFLYDTSSTGDAVSTILEYTLETVEELENGKSE